MNCSYGVCKEYKKKPFKCNGLTAILVNTREEPIIFYVGNNDLSASTSWFFSFLKNSIYVDTIKYLKMVYQMGDVKDGQSAVNFTKWEVRKFY